MQSLKFNKEYLFGFETLVFATSGIVSMHNQLVTLQRERKLETTPLNITAQWLNVSEWRLFVNLT